MSGDDTARLLVAAASAVLLDFDGPVGEVFAGYPAGRVADDVRRVIHAAGMPLLDDLADTQDPLTVLRLVAQRRPDLTGAVDDALTIAELHASCMSRPTAGARAFLVACRTARRPVVIVSNNSAACVRAYLARHDLVGHVTAVLGRPRHRPDLMKPHPGLVEAALARVRVEPARAVLLGDSVTDVEVALACRVPVIGLANKPGKRDRLAAAGAEVIIEAMTELVVPEAV